MDWKCNDFQLDPCVRCSLCVGTTGGARAWFVDFPTIDHDMNLSNTVKLFEPHHVPAADRQQR